MLSNYSRFQNLLNRYMYKDVCTVYRQAKVMAEDGSDDYAMAAVYKDVPCNLAQYGRQLEAQKEDRGYIIKTDLRLNLSPEYDLKPNDVIKVTTAEGQQFTLNASRSHKYPTHQIVTLRRKEEA